MLAERYHDSPRLEQRPERLAYRGARLDRHGPSFRVVVHAFHRRDIDDHLHVGIRHESFEAVPAAGHDETPSFPYTFLDRGDDLIGRVDEPDVVWTRTQPLVETLVDHRDVPRIAGADLGGFRVRVAS